MADAHSLQHDIEHEIEKLREEVGEVRHYMDRGEPHESLHPLNNGHETIQRIEQLWEELKHLVEHL